MIIDGSQSIGALPYDNENIKPDALFTVGYKWLLGPFSLGRGYYGEYFDGGIPLEENWVNRKHSKDFQNLVNYTDEYGPIAARYNVGQNSNFHLVPILNETIMNYYQACVGAGVTDTRKESLCAPLSIIS